MDLGPDGVGVARKPVGQKARKQPELWLAVLVTPDATGVCVLGELCPRFTRLCRWKRVDRFVLLGEQSQEKI